MKNPLSDIKVVELSTYVAAPAASRMLADMGANIIKVETITGDQWRTQGELLLNTTSQENPYFDIYNTGKKCISINIKNPDGMNLMLKLLEDADVFITNTRANSLKKLGLDANTLRTRFPKLIYASVDGYGELGPEAAKPGFDNLAFWARSGFAIDIPLQTDSSYPVPATSGIGDCVTSGFLLANIMAALYNRSITGNGDHINVSLYNCGIWVMSAMLLRADPHYGGHYPVGPYFGNPLTSNYKCADGEWVIISERAYDKDAPMMYQILGIEKEVQEGQINKDNYYNKSEYLIPIIQKAFLKGTSSEWIYKFREKDLVIEKLTHIKDILTDEQAHANRFVETIVNRNGYRSTVASPPIRLESIEKKEKKPASLLGENTDEIMLSYGYTENEISKMREEGAVK